MIDADGTPKVIEYNCRFGDPETQPIMMRMESDLVDLCLDAIDENLENAESYWDPRASIGVVLAAGGYPASYDKGDIISGLSSQENDCAKVFHAGTSEKEGNVVTNGGRVLCATALGNSVSEAQKSAYELASTISWKGMFHRNDIGYRAIERENQK
jgi:phosphoribosylamine--glycine ligase